MRGGARCNAVMRVTRNMRPSTDSLIMGAAINKPLAELAHREGRRRKGMRCRQQWKRKRGFGPCWILQLNCIVNLQRAREDQSDRQPATNEEDPLFFSWAANGTCACGGNAEQRSGRKEASERGGLAIPLIGILGSGCSYNSEGQQESTRKNCTSWNECS